MRISFFAVALLCTLGLMGQDNQHELIVSQEIRKDSLKIQDEDFYFIQYGLIRIEQQEVVKFKEKYQVGIIFGGCVIDPVSYDMAVENNEFVANYLSEKYGDAWKQDLPFLPMGINVQ